MTYKEILKKIIDKAYPENDGKYDFEDMLKEDYYFSIIFSHDFAKDFWGKKYLNCRDCGAENVKDCNCLNPTGLIERWKWYLQQMVLEEDPIKYLEKFL